MDQTANLIIYRVSTDFACIEYYDIFFRLCIISSSEEKIWSTKDFFHYLRVSNVQIPFIRTMSIVKQT